MIIGAASASTSWPPTPPPEPPPQPRWMCRECMPGLGLSVRPSREYHEKKKHVHKLSAQTQFKNHFIFIEFANFNATNRVLKYMCCCCCFCGLLRVRVGALRSYSWVIIFFHQQMQLNEPMSRFFGNSSSSTTTATNTQTEMHQSTYMNICIMLCCTGWDGGVQIRPISRYYGGCWHSIGLLLKDGFSAHDHHNLNDF